MANFKIFFSENILVVTVLFRNKIIVFNATLMPQQTKQPELVKQRELYFDQTPQTFTILKTGEIMTGSSQVRFNSGKYSFENIQIG